MHPCLLCCNVVEGERRVGEDQGKMDGLKEELRDRTQRVNELEVRHQLVRYARTECVLM